MKFTAILPKDYKVSLLARFISPIESAQNWWKTNCNYFYLGAEHKISRIFFPCLVEENAHLCTENIAPKDVIASQRKHSCSLCVKAG